MSIAKLVTSPWREGREAGGAWRIVDWRDDDGLACRTLYHHSTAMFSWCVNDPTVYWGYSTGHGSASDQQGMNKVFRALGLTHLYFVRAGGARIEGWQR